MASVAVDLLSQNPIPTSTFFYFSFSTLVPNFQLHDLIFNFTFQPLLLPIITMSETCIVCLGDLESANALPHPAIPALKAEDDEHAGPVPSIHKSPTRFDDHDSEMIAHLLPCGHNLHDECLKPWVERANSCPICRQNFNIVELSTKVGGESSMPGGQIVQGAADQLHT